MITQKYVEKLKNDICDVWESTRETSSGNIYRGHTRSISTDVEDKIAEFISNVLDSNVDLYLDPSIRIDRKTYRPDLLVVRDDNVVAMLEIKSNMGWCRNAEKVIDEELDNRHQLFCNKGNIECKFSSTDERKRVHYNDEVKLFLIALTSRNGAKQKQIDKNKEYAKLKGASHYLLFNGWYDSLEDREIDDFVKELSSL